MAATPPTKLRRERSSVMRWCRRWQSGLLQRHPAARMGPKRQGKDVTVSLEVVICTAIDWVDSLAFGDRVGNAGGGSYGGSVQSADLPVSVAFLAEPDFPGFSLTALAHLCGQHAASPGRFGLDNGAWCQQRLDWGLAAALTTAPFSLQPSRPDIQCLRNERLEVIDVLGWSVQQHWLRSVAQGEGTCLQRQRQRSGCKCQAASTGEF